MTYDFDKQIDLKCAGGEKYCNLEAIFGTDDVLPLWVADMDFEVAPVITEAIRRRAEHPVYGYFIREDSFYDAVGGWLRRRGGWSAEREWIGFSPGVVAGCVTAIRALTAEGDGILIQPPVYPAFAASIKANGRRVVNNPLRETDGRFEIDFEDMDRKLSQCKLFLMCSPHNPTGRVFTATELERMGELCARHGVRVISDEIHSDIVFRPHRHIHTATASDYLRDNTVTLLAPSKTFNVPGFSSSVTVIPDKRLRDLFTAEMDKYHIGMGNIFGTEAMVAAYGGGDEWLDQVLDYIHSNMEYVASFVERELPGVKIFRTEGTFLMWMDFTAWGMPHRQLASFMVRDARLGLGDGLRFGEEGRCRMRINIATRRAQLEEAMRRLKDAAQKIGKER